MARIAPESQVSASSRQQALARLRNEIAAMENRPALQEGSSFYLETARGVPLVSAGSTHEVFVDHYALSGAGLLFALMQAQGLTAPGRDAVLWLQLCHEGQEAGVLYPPGLVSLGLDPDRVVMGRVQTIEDMLWMIEEALSCTAMSAVIADVAGFYKQLDFTVSRRLSLRAEALGVTLFLLRQGVGREASAMRFRWHVSAGQSAGQPFDARAPGPAQLLVTLEKGQTHTKQTGAQWKLNWTKDGFATGDNLAIGKDTASPDRGKALSGALSA